MLEGAKDGVNVTLKENKDTRSNRQNAFYWATVNDISKFMKEAGAYFTLQNVKLDYTSNLIHDINKEQFTIKTTTGLNVKDFIEYMDSVTAFWSSRTNYQWQPTEKFKE